MSNNLKDVQITKKFKNLLGIKNKEDLIEHNAIMMSLRILAQVELICDRKKITRSELAQMLKTSRSYITQLFRGNKLLNIKMIARMETVLKSELITIIKSKP